MWYFCAILLLPLVGAQAEGDEHILMDVLFCQPKAPVSGLLKMFDTDQMFSYNFTDGSSIPRKRDFKNWADHSFPNPTTISNDAKLCESFLEQLTSKLEDITPEAIGNTKVKVLTAHPVSMGEPNTLICFVSDIYPPVLTITWSHKDEEVTEGVSSSGYLLMPDETYQTFSYLNFTPHYHDVYSCIVNGVGENMTAVGFWVPQYPVPSAVLENALCGLAVAFGIVFFILGVVLLCLTCKLQRQTE
ncbi:class II histocompatibility antigen, M alpha chain [Pelodytes ibericus]